MESTSMADESQAATESEQAKNESEDEALVSRAQELMAKITASEENPSAKVIHALASMLETQESRYLQELGHSLSANGRTSHNIGKLGNLIRENDEFFELISSKFLTESRYSVSVRSAAARLLLICSAAWMYPHIFEDAVLENIKRWVMDDPVKPSGGVCNRRLEFGRNNSTNSDSEMLRTYATGLLAVSLAGGGQVVEDVLTSGLSTKLMRYLRTRVLGETSVSQKDGNYVSENKHTSSATSVRNREESRGRLRQVLDATHLEGTRIGDERLLETDQIEKDHERNISTRPVSGDECWGEGVESLNSEELEDASPEVVGVYEADGDVVEQVGEERWHSRDGKAKYGRPTRDEAPDENARDDLSRRRVNRGWMRNRGTGRINEGDVETERTLTSPGGRSIRDKNLPKNIDIKRMLDEKKYVKGTGTDGNILETEDNDDCLKECRVGTKDISELVNKATKAAKAEARAFNAPAEAIKAAGDAAAELVKTAALEALKSTNDEEAAVLAASKAASTVVDAAVATEVSRSASKNNEDLVSSRLIEPETDEELEEFFVLDDESLSQLREKYCIQCLETLGEYVEVLGPVLHEKGVDVCLALLQRSFKHKDVPENFLLLPDVLKLICNLSAHRKFAALFVDRGGMQKLLAVERVSQTFFGLSSCLFTIGSLQGIMERVCALPSDVVHQVVELALQLLECTQDQARKNAAIFFAAAFVFRAVLDSFDAQEGLQKMLKFLQGAASVRSGVNSGALSLSNMETLRNDRSPTEVLTSSEKQIAYHTCVALRQYFRAHLLLLVDSLRPNKISRARNIPSARAAYKPLDISNEAMDAVFLQIQRDRKLGPAFVRTRWAVVDKFLGSNGHTTMLELCQAPPGERYLHDLAQYALGVLHIVTLVPYSRKLIVSATLSNERVGMAVILDAANGSGYVDPEVIQPALNLLVNLVCPPPSISNKPPLPAQGQQSVSAQASNGLAVENNGSGRHAERNISDRRISLGPGSGCAGLAAQLEQGYRQAREAVRANNGIKVLLHLLHPRIFTPPAALDCLRALACQVLLGLARDDTIAHILTKLQVGKKLSELIRDSGSQASGTEQGRWQTELAQVAIELIAIVTNSGRASTLAATDAAAPTLRRIERAAIAAATPITYHSKELLLLIHEHLQASGLTSTADALLKEAQLTPLLSLSAPPPLHQISVQETSSIQRLHWPSGRAPRGFLADTTKVTPKDEGPSLKSDSIVFGSKKKPLVFSPSLSFHVKTQTPSLTNKISSALKSPSAPLVPLETSTPSVLKPSLDMDLSYKTPILLPMKRKQMESKDPSFSSPAKRLNTADLGFQSPFCQTPNTFRKSSLLPVDALGFSSTPRFTYGRSTPNSFVTDNPDDIQYHGSQMTPQQLGVLADPQSGNTERVTLDSLVVQYLKHQHRQCPTPITTLPPLSLLHPHICPEPSHELDAPMNVTARLSTREFRNRYGGIHGHRRNRHFVYSRFRPWRTCRDESIILTSLAFLGDSSRIVSGTHSGELKVFDTSSGNILESHACHQSPVTLVQSSLAAGTQLILSSSAYDVKLWDPVSVSGEPVHTFDGCKAARFSHSGSSFAALSSESGHREVLLYDIQTHALDLKLSDNSSIPAGPVRGHGHPLIHFSPSDTMLLWNGVLWDRRGSGPIHRFDQFTDYGGGGFQPAGNEVIINSEVWDLRKFKLLRSVPSLDQTVITYNSSGDVIYAILRRNLEDITSAVYTRRVRHPLYAAFRTIDAVNYSDISTVHVDRGVLAFAKEPTDSFVGVVSLDNQEDMFSSARLYEIGRRRPTDDDSDPDDGGQTDDEDDDDESECDGDHPILDPTDLESDDDSDGNGDDEIDDEDEDDGEFNIDDIEFGGGAGLLDMVSDGDDGDDDGDDEDSEVLESFSSGDEGGFGGHRFGF